MRPLTTGDLAIITGHSSQGGCKQARTFLKVNFLMQMIYKPTRGHAVLDLLHMNKEELIEGVKVDDCLGHG